MVLAQIAQYDQPGEGHLYGAIVAALGNYRAVRSRGGYAENHWDSLSQSQAPVALLILRGRNKSAVS